MKTRTATSLIGLVALSASLAMPIAFAQDAAQTTPRKQSNAYGATAQEPATSSAPKQGQRWADVDSNGDGNISREEATASPALAQVFSQADSNADGNLSTDEYKAYVARQQSDAATRNSSAGKKK